MTLWMHDHPLRVMAIVVAFVVVACIISFAAYVNGNPDGDDYDDWD